MTQEEKANAYDEMVHKIKELYETGDDSTRQQMESICPEIAKSEDEKLREWLYEYIGRVGKTWGNQPFPYTQILTWIEKQKEPPKKVKGWVARDKDGNITLYEDKPFRDGEIWKGCSWKSSMIYDLFLPDLKWEDEPVEVELSITRTTNKD